MEREIVQGGLVYFNFLFVNFGVPFHTFNPYRYEVYMSKVDLDDPNSLGIKLSNCAKKMRERDMLSIL